MMAKRKRPKTEPEPTLFDKRWAEACKYMKTGVLNTTKFRDVWLEWWEYRKEKGRSCRLVPTTVRYQIRRLEKWGHGKAVASLVRSMEHGWTGLFENAQESGQRASVDSPQPHAAKGKYDKVRKRSAKGGA